MSNAIFTGVSGLQANQEALQVIGNNLANSTTTGFKSQSIDFNDLFYQTLGNTGPNPAQTGSGVTAGAIQSLQSQGSLNPTGNSFDLGIQGAGFFVVNNGLANQFTRAGSFTLDQNNYLVDSGTGFAVQRFGQLGEGGGANQAFQVPGDSRIRIPLGSGIPAQATSSVTLAGNLDATAAVGATAQSAIQIYDSQGTTHVLSINFTKASANTWTLSASLPVTEGTVTIPNSPISLTFGTNGAFKGATDSTGATLTPPTPFMNFTITSPNALPTQNLTFKLGAVNGFDGLTQFGSSTGASATNQDGFSAGFLSSVKIGKDGVVSGVFSNGQIQPVAQVALATFANTGGLSREGNNLFSSTAQSGNAQIGVPNAQGRGTINQGTLEGSNVDTATQLTALIIAQNGFQINSKVITVNNQILQSLTQIIQ